MAEQQEVQCQDEVEDEAATNYKAPAQKSVNEILDTDKDDESLQKYKQTLLGAGGGGDFAELFPGKSNCIVRKMIIKIEGRPDQEIDFEDQGNLNNIKFEVKEGVEYQLCIKFNVQREILSGLKLVNKVSRLKLSEKSSTMFGSYAPNKTASDIHECMTAKENFPSGLLSRGEYNVVSLFTDDDKTEHCKWTWSFKIKKDWKD